jgi:hypothetical protein
VLLTVSDTGAGMAEDVRSHVFEPFFTTKELGKGTGLGLSTVYGIVRQSGGHISVDSTPGEGTTFEILFPAVGQTSRPPTDGLVSELRQAGTETILVVDDVKEVRAVAGHTLRTLGYIVLEADSGAAALAIAVGKRLKAGRPDVKTLYMSGYSSGYNDGVIDPSGLAASDSFIPKPFDRASLAAKIRQVLDGRACSGVAQVKDGDVRAREALRTARCATRVARNCDVLSVP